MKAALRLIIPAMTLAGIVTGAVAWLEGTAVLALTSSPVWPWRARLGWAKTSPAR